MKKLIPVILLIIIIIAGYGMLKTEYPDLQMPIINRYVGDEEASTSGSPYKTYFYQLKNIEKQAYNMVLESVYDMPEKILVPNLTAEELDHVFSALLNDNPDLFFLGRHCKTSTELWNFYLCFDYLMTPEEYSEAKLEMKEKADMIALSYTDPSDEWQTELQIHDYIVGHCKYKLEDKVYVYSSAYGCLINGEAACEGYSKAAKYLFDEIGIESILVSGKATDSSGTPGDHMWNIVKIDGEWYHLDVTWDDPVTNEGGLKMHSYFNMNDEMISKNHSDFSYNPGCTATVGNYYNRKNLTFESYSSANETQIKNAIVEQYNSGVKDITLNFVNESSYNRAFGSLIDDKRIFKILDNARSKTGALIADKLTGYIPDENLYTLTFSFD